MKMANHDCCEKKHCKCRGFLKFVFGAGVLGLLAHMGYGYLEERRGSEADCNMGSCCCRCC